MTPAAWVWRGLSIAARWWPARVEASPKGWSLNFVETGGLVVKEDK